jgi:hypothetical protein
VTIELGYGLLDKLVVALTLKARRLHALSSTQPAAAHATVKAAAAMAFLLWLSMPGEYSRPDDKCSPCVKPPHAKLAFDAAAGRHSVACSIGERRTSRFLTPDGCRNSSCCERRYGEEVCVLAFLGDSLIKGFIPELVAGLLFASNGELANERS